MPVTRTFKFKFPLEDRDLEHACAPPCLRRLSTAAGSGGRPTQIGALARCAGTALFDDSLKPAKMTSPLNGQLARQALPGEAPWRSPVPLAHAYVQPTRVCWSRELEAALHSVSLCCRRADLLEGYGSAEHFDPL
jgi:hypothetical protein